MPKHAVLLFLLAMALCPFALNAQAQFGLKVGGHLSNLWHISPASVTAPYDLEPVPGFQVGLFGQWNIGGRFYLQSEPAYTRRGFHYMRTNFVPVQLQVRAHYLSLPLLLGYRFGSLSMQVGPEIGYLLRVTHGERGKPRYESPLTELDFYPDFDAGFSLGVQYEWRRLWLGLRYYGGMTHFERWSLTDFNGEPTGDVRGFHQSLLLQLGVPLYKTKG